MIYSFLLVTFRPTLDLRPFLQGEPGANGAAGSPGLAVSVTQRRHKPLCVFPAVVLWPDVNAATCFVFRDNVVSLASEVVLALLVLPVLVELTATLDLLALL